MIEVFILKRIQFEVGVVKFPKNLAALRRDEPCGVRDALSARISCRFSCKWLRIALETLKCHLVYEWKLPRIFLSRDNGDEDLRECCATATAGH